MEWLWNIRHYERRRRRLHFVRCSQVLVESDEIIEPAASSSDYDILATVAKLLQIEKIIDKNATVNAVDDFIRNQFNCQSCKVLQWKKEEKENYMGLALFVPDIGSIVVIHFITDSDDNVLEQHRRISENNCSQSNVVDLAATFVQEVIDCVVTLKLNSEKWRLIITGHSLGGWLAQITYLTGKYLEFSDEYFVTSSLQPKLNNLILCLVFDPPGCLEIVNDLKEKYLIEEDYLSQPAVYLTSPSLINTLGHHWGELKRIFSRENYSLSFKNPYDSHVVLNTTVTSISDLHKYLNQGVPVNIDHWPTTSSLDFIHSKKIQEFGVTLSAETSDEDSNSLPIQKSLKYEGTIKMYRVGNDEKIINKNLLENFYIWFGNSNPSSVSRFIGEGVGDLKIENSKKRMEMAVHAGRNFVLTVLPKKPSVSRTVFNTSHTVESICKVIAYLLLPENSPVFVSECYESKVEGKTCIAVLKSRVNENAVIMLSGLNKRCIDLLTNSNGPLSINEIMNKATENQTCENYVEEGSEIFECLCLNNIAKRILWLHVRGDLFLFKFIYDRALRIKRVYKEDNDLCHLVGSYDNIFIYGDAGIGKTNELCNLMSEVDQFVIYIRIIDLTSLDYQRMELITKEERSPHKINQITNLFKQFLIFHEDDKDLIEQIIENIIRDEGQSKCLICFDGLDLAPQVCGEYKPKATIRAFLKCLKNNTNVQFIITARRKTSYLSQIENDIRKGFPKLKMWSGDIKSVEFEKLKDILSVYNIVADMGKTLHGHLIDPKEEYRYFDILRAELLPLINKNISEIKQLNLYSFHNVLIRKRIVEVNKGKFIDEEFVSLILKTLKQDVLKTFLRSGSNLLKREPTVVSFWESSSDLMLEFLFADAWLECAMEGTWAHIDDFKKILDQEEYYGARAAVNALVKSKRDLNQSNGLQSDFCMCPVELPREETTEEDNNEWARRVLFRLIEEDRIHLIEIYSHTLLENIDNNGYTVLHVAVRNNNEKAVSVIISLKSDLMFKHGQNDFTPLHVAASRGYGSIVKELLKHSDIGEKDSNGCTPLHLAVQNNFLSVVKDIVQKNSQIIHEKNKSGDTSLNLAAQIGALDIVEYLLEYGADIDDPNNKGLTPFLTAINNKHLNLLTSFTRRGCDEAVKSLCGFKAIHYAAGRNSVEIINYLVERENKKCGNIINVKTSNGGLTPLHLASGNGCFDSVKRLVQLGAKIEEVDKMKRLPLHLCASMGYFDITKYMVGQLRNNNKFDLINAACSHGFTPLHLACKNGWHNIANYLIRERAKCFTSSSNGLTPLESAVNSKHNSCFPAETIKLILSDKDWSNNANISLLSFGVKNKIALPGELIDYILDNTKDDSLKTEGGFQSIHFAAYHGDIYLLEKLKNKIGSHEYYNSVMNSQSYKGYTPIYITVAVKSDREVNKLLEWNVDLRKADENGITPFHLACYYGKDWMVNNIAERCNDLVNLKTKNDLTPLHLAVDSGHIDIVRKLVRKYGSLLDNKDANGFTPLHLASFLGRLEIVQFLIDRNNDMSYINETTLDGSTPLNLAVRQGKFETVTCLLDNKADASIPDKNGYTPLHNAAYQGRLNIIQYFVENAIYDDLNLRTNFGSTAIFLAVKQKHHEIVKLLLQNNVKMNIEYKNDLTPIHLAALTGEKDILQTLLEFEGNVDVKDVVGRTPLYLASMAGHKNIVDLLISKNTCAIFQPQIQGWRPIHVAVMESHENIVKTLCETSSECVNQMTNLGDIALHFAAWKGNEELMKFLIDNGTETGVTNEFEITPLDLAVSQGFAHPIRCITEQCGKCSLYQYLFEHGHSLSFLVDITEVDKIEYEAVRKGKLKVVEYLATELKANFYTNLSRNKRTPIHAAVEFSRLNILQYFHELELDLNVLVPELEETPLYIAVVENNLDAVEKLIELGADVNIGDVNGWTPLHAAAFKNFRDIVDCLCRNRKCNINALSKFDLTPLYVCVQYNKLEALYELIDHNVDPTITDKNNYSPLRVAEMNLDQFKQQTDSDSEDFRRCQLVYNCINEYTQNWSSPKRKRSAQDILAGI